jgi:hypothetical protein
VVRLGRERLLEQRRRLGGLGGGTRDQLIGRAGGQRREELLDHRGRLQADELVDDPAVAEGLDGGDPLDAELLGEPWCLVDVQLDHEDVAGEAVGHLLEQR